MPDTYTLLEKVVIGATSAERITFTSIPQDYTDLKIVGSVRSESPNPYDFMYCYVNGVSGSYYPGRRLRGDGSNASSASNSLSYGNFEYVNGDGATANTFGNFEMYFPNYSGSAQKSFSIDSAQETNNVTAYLHAWAYNYTNGTSAITSIVLASGSGYFKQYSTFYLYGIAKLGVTSTSAPKATGGDEIKLVGNYWYHIFRSSGTFRPSSNLACSVLSLGGGGGGGISTGGGGGGGELDLYSTINTTANTNYTATIGAGGAGSNNFAFRYNGNTTTFSTITSLGGGGGGNEQTLVNGGDGGSGGGGGWNGSNGSASGSNTFAGGNGYNASGQSAGGGGGGATAAGGNGSNTNGGNGGQGYALSTADSNLTSGNFSTFQGMTVIASGGGAGASSTRTAGTGGTGAGNGTNSLTAGGAATSYGSGGGGGGWVGGVGVGNGGNGAGGLVVIRYSAV